MEMNDSFSNRLRKAMDLRNLKPSELSNKTNIDKSLISNYLSGNYKAKQDKVYTLALALNVSEGWLMGYDVSIDRERANDNTTVTNLTSGMVTIPILGKIPSGSSIEEIDDVIGYEVIPADWMMNGDKYFAFQIDGDNMLPEYKKNDIIIIKEQSDCNNNQDCIVVVNGYDAVFRKIIKEEDGIKIKPINNDYETKKYSNADIIKKPIIILGVAKEVRRKIM